VVLALRAVDVQVILTVVVELSTMEHPVKDFLEEILEILRPATTAIIQEVEVVPVNAEQADQIDPPAATAVNIHR
jgi:hypothetical protein